MKVVKTDWIFASTNSSRYLTIFSFETIECVNDQIDVIQRGVDDSQFICNCFDI
ncbi:hypothetical protein A2U01_0109066, partial [Trifolium medium]|nr:hypothetical protein [Trifolium medium]